MIRHVLYVQPIFAPDQRRTERNINSIQTMGSYLKANGTDGLQVTIIFGGWAKNDEMWNQLVEAIKIHFGPSVQPIRFDKNYGKAMVVKKLIELTQQQRLDFQAILTSDSDILFPSENKHMFGRLAFAAIQLEAVKKKPFGMLALNQTGEGCHWKQCYENTTQYSMNIGPEMVTEKIVWPTNPSGIAGGCIFMSRRMWEAVGGYRVMGVYAGDDAWLLVDCYLKGFSHQMIDTLAIVHPPENDAEYSQWKVRVCQRDSATGPKQNIDQQIQEAEGFWNAR